MIELDDKFVEALKRHAEIEDARKDTVMELREDYQYGVRKEVNDKNRLKELIDFCRELLNIAKEEVYKNK